MGNINLRWSSLIINELVHCGITYFCIAPGSRSTPLTIAAENHLDTTTQIHYDERGLAFHAIGYAKATKTPAAIIVTSGTAVGNLLPAIMEAHHSQTPLIILTADRPFELLDCAANQTTRQTHIFQPWLRWECDFTVPNKAISSHVVLSKVRHAASCSMTGPVHINVPFRDPLFEHDAVEKRCSYLSPYIKGSFSLVEKQVKSLKEKLSSVKKPLVVIGGDVNSFALNFIEDFAKQNHIPVICDLFAKPYLPNTLKYTDWIDKPSPDCIIQFGSKLISKKLTQWIESIHPSTYIQVSPYDNHLDPTHLVTDRVICTEENFCEQIGSLFFDPSWSQIWLDKEQLIAEMIDGFIDEQTPFSEPVFFHRFHDYFDNQIPLFIGNSMPVRDANNFLQYSGPIYGNRGLSGIDGNIATATGIACGKNQAINVIIGDLTFLADMNSLSMLKTCSYPIRLFVINNSGGGIFSHLPVRKSKHFSKCFSTKHHYSFEHLAAQFNIPYYYIQSYADMNQVFAKTSLIELKTCATNNTAIYEKINEMTKNALYA